MKNVERNIRRRALFKGIRKVRDKKIDVVNSGQWIPKSKFDEVIKEK